MKQSAIARLWLILAAAAIILALSACGGKPDSTEGSGPAADQPTPSPTTAPTPTATAALKEEQINVYYTDDNLMDLKEQKADIQYEDEPGKIEAAFKALQQDEGDDLISLWKGIELLSAKEESGAVTLDIHIPDEVRMGAPGEELAIEAVSKTMFQFDDVKTIDILVDGEKADSLMGHEDLDHPIERH